MSALPRHLAWLTALYFVASLLHFVHNAEYLPYYPNMPASISRETVYWAWAAVTLPGAVALLLLRLQWRRAGAVLLAAYGLLGLDGLLHYTLALCSEHALAANLTIAFESLAGSALAVAAFSAFRKR